LAADNLYDGVQERFGNGAFSMKRADFRYVEMAAKLRTEILSGYLKPGEFLLSEKELCEKYAISRNSLRQALELLTAEGLIVKMAGRGNMVAKQFRMDDPDANTLVVMSPYPSTFAEKALPLLSAMFKERYPNTDVKLLYTSYEMSSFLRDLNGIGVKPDLVLVWDRHFRQLSADDFVPVSDPPDGPEDIHPKLLRAYEKDGSRFAVPVTFSPIFLACNADMFEACGVKWPDEEWSMEQFVQSAKRMTADTNGDGLADRFGFGLSHSLFRWPVLARKYGYRLGCDADGRLNMEGLREALKFMQDLIYRETVSPAACVGDLTLLNKLFAQGKIGMTLTSALATDLGGNGFAVRIAPLPKRGAAPGGSLMIANGLVVSKRSRKTELAMRFAQFALSEQFQRKMAERAGFLSIYDSVNRERWTPPERKRMGIEPDDLEMSGFMHEWLPDRSWIRRLQIGMKAFWAGMETPEAVVAGLKGES